ncbi:MAG: ATP-binding cassette domain-containing protein [Lachnospiraceae bacterium]|nr:ATP-binding cassette domain-containing protein [Lachnospiraceae bacterium]
MAAIEVKDVSFTYPTAEGQALDHISFGVEEGEFLVVCGKSGCGKSTLLRHMKKKLIPYGMMEGEVCYYGKNVTELEDRVAASEIGFVSQNPDNQIVTDKVWHELAFGLESLGLSNEIIKRRVAEMASFFEIQSWFRKDVVTLSGGQKQLLNLASVMVMQPKVLILDEPTSQLDPIAASEFLKTVYKINQELGTTIIISEHRLEELFTMAGKVLVMDRGKKVALDQPEHIGMKLAKEHNPMFYGLPAISKIYAKTREKGLDPYLVNGQEKPPLTILEGKRWLKQILGDKTYSAPSFTTGEREKKDVVLEVKDVYFSYSKHQEPVLRGLNLSLEKGQLYCLLGGNGVGKSTTLKSICGIVEPQSGHITISGKEMKKKHRNDFFPGSLAMVPQNPQSLFTEITVEDELLEVVLPMKISDEEKVSMVEEMLEKMELSALRENHPYDLSGGEQQRLAIGKILLLKPKILLMDEPTKGLDPFFKRTLAGILKDLTKEGMSILMVSHDVEFCASYADRCAMFFDGEITSEGEAVPFFAGNCFYTTGANRLLRNWFPDAVTWESVVRRLVHE